MPQGDGSKRECFALWLAGKRVGEIQKLVTAKPGNVMAWIKDWERGRAGKWDF